MFDNAILIYYVKSPSTSGSSKSGFIIPPYRKRGELHRMDARTALRCYATNKCPLRYPFYLRSRRLLISLPSPYCIILHNRRFFKGAPSHNGVLVATTATYSSVHMALCRLSERGPIKYQANNLRLTKMRTISGLRRWIYTKIAKSMIHCLQSIGLSKKFQQ